jgi:phosphohistidine phosphatase
MDLYLMQHGQATTETEDPERPLTDAGRAAVQRVAKRARAADVRISGCLHSGKLRAEQTACEGDRRRGERRGPTGSCAE